MLKSSLTFKPRSNSTLPFDSLLPNLCTPTCSVDHLHVWHFGSRVMTAARIRRYRLRFVEHSRYPGLMLVAKRYTAPASNLPTHSDTVIWNKEVAHGHDAQPYCTNSVVDLLIVVCYFDWSLGEMWHIKFFIDSFLLVVVKIYWNAQYKPLAVNAKVQFEVQSAYGARSIWHHNWIFNCGFLLVIKMFATARLANLDKLLESI